MTTVGTAPGTTDTVDPAFKPKHRVAPQPVSSGVSFRKLPDATLLQVIKCCQHYEKKCAGFYSSKTPAARFVYDMSREVQDLVCLLRDRAQERERRIKMLEALVKDWCEVFGDPGAAVTTTGVVTPHSTPREVAAKLVNQAKEISKLTKHQDVLHRHYETELEQLRQAMRDQARAVRDQFHAQTVALETKTRGEVKKARAAVESVAVEKKRLLDAFSQTVEDEVTSRIDKVVQATCAEALEMKAEAIKITTAAQTEVKTLRTQLSQTETSFHQMQAETTHTIARLTQETQTQQQQLKDLHVKMTHDKAVMKRDARRKVEAAIEEQNQRFDADRIKALEDHSQWLAKRVTELQELLDASQRGLANRAHLWPEAIRR